MHDGIVEDKYTGPEIEDLLIDEVKAMSADDLEKALNQIFEQDPIETARLIGDDLGRLTEFLQAVLDYDAAVAELFASARTLVVAAKFYGVIA